MKNTVLKYLIFLLLFPVTGSFATHIVGGEVFYDCLGNNNYRITLYVYRDCGPNNTNGTGFDDPAPIGIYQGNGILLNTLSVPITSVVSVPVVINDPCLQSPPNICVEKATYTTVVNLPPILDGYDIVYQRCCRNPSIINIVNSSAYGASYISHIPSSSVTTCNSSPRFNQLPPLVICNGSNFSFDHSAMDPDGDILEYSFYTPFDGGDQANPAPNPPLPPPFATVVWGAGFSQSNQISGTPNFTVNQSTGLFAGSPTMNGLYVYGIKVKEIRNGVVLSESYREFQTTVTNCPSVVVSSIPVQTQFCSGPTITLGNNSQNSTYYHWDFGVSSMTNDTSNLATPTFTYPDTGTFTITLIANPGFSCADTATQQYSFHDPLNPFFPRPDPECINVNSFDFIVSGNFTPAADVTWAFGINSNPDSSSLHNPQNIIYSDSGHYVVNVTVTQFGCTDSYSDTITVFPLPVINFSYPMQDGCAPYLVQFADSTYAWSPLSYLWTFGDGSFSTDASPSHTYQNEGVYDLSLTIAVDSVCQFTQTITIDSAIIVHPSPHAQVSVNPTEVSIYDPLFTVYDESWGRIIQTITLDDGFVTNDSIFEHVFFTSGNHIIFQLVENEFGCTDTATAILFVRPETTIFAPNAFTPNGDGLNDVFIPYVYDVTEYTFTIYDRWGQAIFVSGELLRGWDGKRNGKLCPQDVYVFQVNYRDWQGIDRVERGHFTLIR